MANDVLSHEECKALEDDRIFLPHPQHGKRKISGSFLSSSSTQSSSSGGDSISSTTSIASVRYHHTKIQSDMEFPEKLESAAALEFIGINPETANEIYNRWRTRPDPNQNPDDLLDYVYGHTTQLRKDSWNNYTDEQVMTRLGVSQWLQDAILHSEYTDIYHTNTLKFWLDDSFQANFKSLIRIQGQLKAYFTVHGRGKKRQKRGSVSDVFPTASTATSSSNPVTAVTQQVATMSMASESGHLPQPHVSIGTAGPILENHEVYYKAKAVDEMGDEPFITSDGSINMSTIQSWAGGDFNSERSAWYWTPELETATKYKEYAEQRVPHSEQWIIRIQVPKGFIQKLKKEELWYSPDWKEYVWCCKKKMPQLPEKFEKYSTPGKDQTDVMVGHICTGVTRIFSKIPKDQVQTRIGEDNVLMIDGKKAKQWVVMHYNVAESLGREIRGKIHIDVFTSKEAKEQ